LWIVDCGFYRFEDLLIARTAAQATGERFADLVARRAGMLVEQRFRSDQEAGRADAALQGGSLQEALLKGMQVALARQPFNRFQRRSFGLNGQHDAAIHRHAVHQHGAGAAVAVVAAFLRSGQPQLVAENFQETLPGFAKKLGFLAVDGGRYMMFFRHR
jgi:hypothetical protein